MRLRSPGQYSGIAPQHCDQHAQAVELGVKEHMGQKNKRNLAAKQVKVMYLFSINSNKDFFQRNVQKVWRCLLGHIPRRNPLHSVYPGCETQGIHIYISARLDHWSRFIALSPRPPLRAMQSCPHKVPLPPPLMQPWDQSCNLHWLETHCALNFLFPSEIVSTESYFVKLSQLNTVYRIPSFGSSHTMSSVCRIYWKYII